MITDPILSPNFTTRVVKFEYIVTFTTYMSTQDQRTVLKNIIGDKGWEYIDRKVTKNFPSDFALVKFSSQRAEELFINILRNRTKEVKRVFPQRQYTGILRQYSHLESLRFEGRFHSKFPEEESDNDRNMHNFLYKRLLQESHSIVDLLNANELWKMNYTGAGVKVAVFDTGLRQNHPHFRHIKHPKEGTYDFTDEDTTDDHIGHGTFVAGVIASSQSCLGLAPDAEIYPFRVFTTNEVSYTTWFLEAFNVALHEGVNILNLSIGGPDFKDEPFVEKVNELSQNNILVISAIGNDGPTYGTLNNPADQLDVIGVGGITFNDGLARFSSRGMTTWELPFGYGRVKPDILAYSQAVSGSHIDGTCHTLSGTSVASPVVAGAVALLASTIPEKDRWKIINPASMKQVLIEGAWLLSQGNIYEQGYGKLNLLESARLLKKYTPRASLSPPELDLTKCPYMWPFCTQPLYYSAMPLIINVTILNGMGVIGNFSEPPKWIPGPNGNLLEISFTYPDAFFPWYGYLGVYIRVIKSAAGFNGTAEGIVRLNITCGTGLKSTVELPIKAQIIPTPLREKRILWDQFHNLRYPSGYFPKDILKNTEPFDWNGDHLHTNFREFYDFLRAEGYFIEILGHPFTCFDASNYGTLLIVDPEEEFFQEEIKKLQDDLENNDLSLMILSDWYNEEIIDKLKFLDDKSQQWWIPVTGGSNLPAVNDLLSKYKISFGKTVYDGKASIDDQFFYFASGAGISSFPKNGILIPFELSDQSLEILENKKETRPVPIIGLYQILPEFKAPSEVISDHPETPKLEPQQAEPKYSNKTGRIVVFGDSSCVDSSNKQGYGMCYWLVKELLLFSSKGIVSDYFIHKHMPIREPYTSRLKPPQRKDNKLDPFSKVIGQRPECIERSFIYINETYIPEKESEHKKIFKEIKSFVTSTENKIVNLPNWVIIGGILTLAVILFYFLYNR